ncbi:MAG: hypothetical protein ACI4DP_03800 [Candidatus Ornithomonoglobus sp.]
MKGSSEIKLSELPIASLDTLGGIKLYGKSVNGVLTNRSGLSIGDDGSMLVLVKANGGLAIDGVGQLYITGANETEVFAGTQQYKPVTPAQFSRFITYSTTPVRIGTWIDGTPVWRQTIPPTKIESTGIIHVEDYLSVSGDTEVIILRTDIFVQNDMTDCTPTATADTETYELKCENRRIYVKSMDNSAYPDHPQMWYGVVEFVTPESNIITETEATS